MKGWQFTKTKEPLELVEKEDPTAQEGYVVIDTGAVGICQLGRWSFRRRKIIKN